MGNKQKQKNEELTAEVDKLNSEIKRLTNIIEEEKLHSKNTLEAKELEWKTQETAKEELYKNEKAFGDSKIKSLEEEVENKQGQLDRKELKKLAEAFSEQEGINKDDQKRWLVSLCIAGGVLIIYAIASIFLTANKPWAERITYYAVDAILISGVWFCVAQFSQSTKLKNDYGNRKTLAQSFNNILNNLSEDEAIRTKFIEKATDVLCSTAGLGDSEPVLTKKLLKDTAEIIGSAVKK